MPDYPEDAMASENEEAKALLRRAGVVELAEACEHDWHYYGTVNGQPDYGCQKCGATRRS